MAVDKVLQLLPEPQFQLLSLLAHLLPVLILQSVHPVLLRHRFNPLLVALTLGAQ